MGSLGEAVLDLSADSTKLKADMDAAHADITKTLDKLGSKMQHAGKWMSIGITAPLTLIGKQSLTMASDFEESLSKVRVVFGDSAGVIEDFASTAATSMGMSEQAALAAAGTYGNLFTAMGIGQEASAEMSTNLVQLASDLASFNNMDPTEVLDKLRAGLSGETEPLKSLGVNLNAATIEAKALELGLWDGTGALDASAKAQASYALIMLQTATAQGDFARTSEGLANQTRIARAELADAGATIGAQLLPYALKIVEVVRDLVGRFTEMSPATQKTVLVVGALAAAIGPLLVVVGSLISAITAIIPVVTAVAGVLTFPLIAIIAAVVAAVALLAAAWANDWGGIREKTAAVVEWIKSTIQAFLGAVQAWWGAHGAQVMSVVGAMWNGIQNIVQTITGIVSSIVQAFQAAFAGDWYTFGAKLREAWDKTWAAIGQAIGNAKEMLLAALPKLIQAVKDFFTKTDWGQIGKNIVQGIANGITNAAQWIVKAAEGVGKAAIAAIKGFLGIKSPSTLFAEVGRNMMAGLALGINQTATMPVLASSNAARMTVGAVTNNSYYLTAQYGYESEGSLIDQVRMLNMIGGA